MGLKPYLLPQQIDALVERVSIELSGALAGRNPLLVGVLKGSYLFLSDLSRKLRMDHEIDFIQTASYGMRDIPATEVLILRDITSDVKGREVVLVEDIIDRGHTAKVLLEHFRAKGAVSVMLCSLLKRRGGAPGVHVDFLGEELGDGFVVGYGMDYKERYRGLPGLHILEE